MLAYPNLSISTLEVWEWENPIVFSPSRYPLKKVNAYESRDGNAYLSLSLLDPFSWTGLAHS